MLIKSKENQSIFGGFTDIAWTNDGGGYKKGNGNSFIFSLRDDNTFVKLKSLIKDHEVYHGTGIAFGYNNLTIFSDCDKKSDSRANLGRNNDYEANGLNQQEAY